MGDHGSRSTLMVLSLFTRFEYTAMEDEVDGQCPRKERWEMLRYPVPSERVVNIVLGRHRCRR